MRLENCACHAEGQGRKGKYIGILFHIVMSCYHFLNQKIIFIDSSPKNNSLDESDYIIVPKFKACWFNLSLIHLDSYTYEGAAWA